LNFEQTHLKDKEKTIEIEKENSNKFEITFNLVLLTITASIGGFMFG